MWRYVLTFVGSERIYVCMEPPSTTHAGDWMFIAPEVVDGRLWHVAHEGRGCSKCGGRARAGEACCSLSHFGLVLGDWSAQSHLHRRGERTTVASVGASWLTHAMRCSCGCVLTCMASWDSTAFGWRGCLMHVMYICIHRLFASLDLTAFWRGGLMQSNAIVELPFDRHKVVMLHGVR